MRDSTAGLNYEKSKRRTLLCLPAILVISTASAELKPPTTLGAETPGMNLLFILSVSKDTNIYYTF